MSAVPHCIVVVTGGASGIGHACSRILAASGWRVVVADLNINAAAMLAEQIGGVAQALDVAEDASVQDAVAQVESRVGPVLGLVNSAGIMQRPLPPDELDMETWDRVQRIDLRGSYLCCREFARGMLRRRNGSIVNISSVTGSRSVPLHSYAPAKAAIVSMTQCLAAEWGPAGVRVNSVAPGYTLTPPLLAAIERGERQHENLTSHAALRRMVRPEQVAEAVAFLLSDKADAITGVDLPVDCGWLAGESWSTYGGFREPA